MTITRHPNQDLIDGLRAMADWLESGHTLPPYTSVQLDIFPTPDQLKVVARTVGGKVEKEARTDWFSLRKDFSRTVYIYWNSRREQVCHRVVTGKTILPATPEVVVPASVIPAQPERTVDIFEWQCPDSLLAEPVLEGAAS